MYYGACSLVYQHLMQIVLHCLLGWDAKKQLGNIAIFDEMEAYSRTEEEQGRNALHGQWQLWARGDALHSDDDSVRNSATEQFLEYF